MKTQTIVTLLVIILIFVGLFFLGYAKKSGPVTPIQNTQPAGPSMSMNALTASTMMQDLGTISMKNGNVTKEFTITNPSAKDITVSTVLTSCMCTTALIVRPDGSTKGPFGMAGHGGSVPPANEVIKAGESRVIRVIYDPNAHGPAGVGQIDRFITLTDTAGNELNLEVKALVTP